MSLGSCRALTELLQAAEWERCVDTSSRLGPRWLWCLARKTRAEADNIPMPYDGGNLRLFPDNLEEYTRSCRVVNTLVILIRVGSEPRWIVPLVIPSPYIALYILARSDPGIITQQNVQKHVLLFKYDNILFVPGVPCRTCKLIKPARSKHCNVCNVCVARHDHHCTVASG